MPVLCLYQPGTNTLIWISSKSEVAIQLFRLILPRFVCGSYSKSAWPNCRIAGLIKNKIETWNVLPWSLIICITNWKKRSRILLWDLKLSMFFFLIIIRCNRHALERINWHTQHVCIMLHNFRLLMGSPGTLDNRPPKQGNLKCSNTTCSNKKIFY